MDATEVAKLRELLAELDRLCADAERIRRKISDVTHAPAVWPDRRASSSVFGEPTSAHDLATVPDGERKN